MAENKNQHYVPEFYLKRFSPDEEKRTIGIWNMSRQRKITGASLSNQCSRDYFYGKDLRTEKSLIDLEGAIAGLLSAIDKTGKLPLRCSDNHALLLLHLVTQRARTRYMSDAINEMNEKFFRHVYGTVAEQEGIDTDKFNIHMEHPTQLSISMAAQGFPMILDLDCKILNNRTSVEFVTSDNPVSFYNQLFSFQKHNSNTGLTVKGMQLFFPIDPRKVLLFYDAGVYSVGRRNCQMVDISRSEDVDQINLLQMCGCQYNVYFRGGSLDLEPLHPRALRFRRRSKTQLDVFSEVNSEPRTRELLAMSFSDVRTDLSLSCVRITRRAKRWRMRFRKQKERPALVVRNQPLYDAYRQYQDRMLKGTVNPAWLFQHLCGMHGPKGELGKSR